MARVYLIQTGKTDWQEQSRLEPLSGSPLSSRGKEQVASVAGELSGQDLGTIYASRGEPERQTAKMLAKKCCVQKRKTDEQLHELDYGLWQGLTVDEFRHRQPSAYRQWTKAPISICPPKGETIVNAQKRLRDALQSLLKRNKKGALTIVLRPLAFNLLRCSLQNEGIENLWEHMDPEQGWASFDLEKDAL